MTSTCSLDYGSINSRSVPLEAKVDHQLFKTNSMEVPQDRYNIVLITMCLFGITSLLPWNFFIQADDYWMYKFRNVSVDSSRVQPQEEKTDLQATFSSYLAIASKVPYMLFLLVNTAVSRRYSPTLRVGIPLAASVLLFCLTVVMVKVNTDRAQLMFLVVSLSTVVAVNVACSFVQGGGTGIAGCLPPKYMKSNVHGQAIGGILASATQILSLLGNTSPTTSAMMYFLCAVATLCVTFVFFCLMEKSEFYKYYMAIQETTRVHKTTHSLESRMSLLDIFKKLWMYAIAVTFNFWVTIAVLPAIVVLVVPTSTASAPLTGKFFLPVACFMLFNICDMGGRFVCGWLTIPPTKGVLTLSLCVMRVVLIPLFMLCNAHPRSHLSVVFDSDIYFVCFIWLLGFTNGYFCSVTLIHGPKMVQEEYQEIAGSIMAFFLGLGLMLGSLTSLVLLKIL